MCWVGFLSVVRVLSLECVGILAASLADFSNQLSGHYRFEVDVEPAQLHNADPKELTSQFLVSVSEV